MFKALIGDLFASQAKVLVNTVNCVGVMGKGVAQEFKKPLIVEPAVADSITGEHWNRYVFRTARNSGQDAIANVNQDPEPNGHPQDR